MSDNATFPLALEQYYTMCCELATKWREYTSERFPQTPLKGSAHARVEEILNEIERLHLPQQESA